jgi:hypothetical protein
MLQIAIWGIAAMLVVKALDVLHQQSISAASDKPGSFTLSTSAAVMAILSAIGLIWMSNMQVASGTGMAPFASSYSRAPVSEAEMAAEMNVADALEGTTSDAMNAVDGPPPAATKVN